ncbi:MAG TPA: glutathione S-transferase family protein [Devosiaceae bacterium]|jgi:glutathione S-transferase
MTHIKLWGRASSLNVQKVRWALEELELDYTQVEVGGRHGGLDRPEYGILNPNRLVPTLQDGDVTVWESHAVLRYLAATYASGLLWPVEPNERAVVDQWTDWTATTFQPAWLGLFWNVVRVPVAEHNAELIAKSAAETRRVFRIMEQRLAKTPYLGGEQLTYADIAAGAAMYRYSTMPADREDLPHVAAWHARLEARKPFQKAVCVSYEEMIGRTSF